MSGPGAHRVLVWGGSGHGSVVAEVVRSTGATVVGFIDRDRGKVGTQVGRTGAAVIASEEELLSALARNTLPGDAASIALGIGDGAARVRAYERVGAARAPAFVHPRALVSDGATLASGSVVFPGVIVETGVDIGEAVILNGAAVIGHDSVVGKGAHIAPGALLSGNVHIGAGSWVGAGAVVIQGLRIGAGCMVGAGAVVIRDVPDGVTVVGNPARILQR